MPENFITENFPAIFFDVVKKSLLIFAGSPIKFSRMETAVVTPRTASKAPKCAKSPKYLLTRDEAKDFLGEYAFSLIDEARESDAKLEKVLDRLDAEGVDTETFEDAALVRMMEEGRTGKYVSLEQLRRSLRRL